MFRPTLILILLSLAACDPAGDAPAANLSQEEKNAFALAETMRKNRNYEGAAAVYRELTLREGDSTAAHLELAALYRETGKTAEALAVMRQAQARAPGNPRVLSQLGYTLIAAGQPEEAVNVFDMLLAMRPDDAMAHNGKAVAFDKAGNHVAAQEIYQKALSLDADSAIIQNNMAMSMILNDQLDQAIALLEPLAKQQDATATMRQNLALAYGLKGDSERALELNLRDLAREQAEENLRFYQHYAKARSQRPAAGKTHPQPGFAGPDAQDLPAKPVVLTREKPKAEPPPVAEASPAAQKEPDEEAEKESFFGKDAVYDFPGAK